jgi:hypothetical protein
MMGKNITLFVSIILFYSSNLYSNFSIIDFKNQWSGQLESIRAADESYIKVITADDLSPSLIEIQPENSIKMWGKFVRVKIRVSDLERLSGIELRLSSDSSYENRIDIAIPIFADKDFNILQSDEWVDYTFTVGNGQTTGTPDINNINKIGIYVESINNSDKILTVDFKDFSVETAALPAMVSMTFDDGYAIQFDIAEVMSKYNLRGTAYVMTEQVGLYGYLTLEQLKIMYSKYHWEISAHHFIPITEMSSVQMNSEFDKTIEFLSQITPTYTKLDENHMSSPALHFAYPLGKQNRQTTMKNITDHFLTARIASGGGETLPPSDWHMLRAYNITNEVTPEMFEERLKLAVENNEWLIPMFHKFTDEETSDDPLIYPMSQFKKICAIISSMGVLSYPVNEVYEAFQ